MNEIKKLITEEILKTMDERKMNTQDWEGFERLHNEKLKKISQRDYVNLALSKLPRDLV